MIKSESNREFSLTICSSMILMEHVWINHLFKGEDHTQKDDLLMISQIDTQFSALKGSSDLIYVFIYFILYIWMFKLIIFENDPNVEGRNYLKLSTLIVYTFELSDILSDLFISNSTLFIVLPIGSILILKVNVSGSFLSAAWISYELYKIIN